MMKAMQFLLSLVVLLISSSLPHLSVAQATTKSCPRGTFPRGSKCEKCPPGTTSSDTRPGIECTPCYRGTFYPFSGALSSNNCLDCPPDTFAATDGSSSCAPCPFGTYSLGRAAKCLKCKPGEGIDRLRNECVACLAGYFNPGSFKHCQQCPSGTQSNRPWGSTKCISCPVGTFRDMRYVSVIDNWRCAPCPKNTYTNKIGTRQCALCPLGMFSKIGSTKCTNCPSNMFRGKVKYGRCISCRSGTFNNGRGPAAACRHPVKGCPFNTFEDKSGTCRACLPGERLDMAMKSCVPCKADEVSHGGATTSCTKCTGNTEPASDISIFERSECRCKLGFTLSETGSCEPCPAGHYGSERPAGALRSNLYRVNYKRQPYCTECHRGSFSSSAGSTRCTICPKDSVAPKEGATQCEKCPSGSRPNDIYDAYFDGLSDYVNNAAYECRTLRHNCQPGEVRKNYNCEQGAGYNRTCGSTERLDARTQYCYRCLPGFSNEASGRHNRTKCIWCPGNGEVRDGKCGCRRGFVRVKQSCRRCPVGLVYKDGGCVGCVNGVTYIQGGVMPRACRRCRGDSYLPDGAQRCVPCPSGHKRMFDVAGNAVNSCRPIDPFGPSLSKV